MRAAMRVLLMLACLALGLSACGSSSKTSSTPPAQTSASQSSPSTESTTTLNTTTTTTTPPVKLTDQQTKALYAQQYNILKLNTQVAGSELANLVHEYETAPTNQKQSILQQIAQVNSLAVKYDEFGNPTGLDQHMLSIALGGGSAPSDPNSAAAGPVSKVISIIKDANASAATTLVPTPGIQAPVQTVSAFIDDLAKQLRQDGVQYQASRLTQFESQLPSG